jgi:hypothetical protein
MLPPAQSMSAEDLRRNMMRTYFTLRLGIVLLAFALPIGLLVYSFYTHGYLKEGSMSAFYGADQGAMRDWFVGILCAIGAFLVLYQGFSRLEDWLLNFAGVFAVLTANTPCNCWEAGSSKSRAHAIFALLFFVCMGAVCLFCARHTVSLLPPADRKKFERTYYAIGVWLFIAPLGALVLARVLGQNSLALFVVEFAAVAVFAIYWAIKSYEIKITSAERKALYGALKNVKGEVVAQPPDVERLRQLSV